jgi:hypothetical protein
MKTEDVKKTLVNELFRLEEVNLFTHFFENPHIFIGIKKTFCPHAG